MGGGPAASGTVTVVVRLPNWLGDTVMAVPTLRALRVWLGPEATLAVAGPWVSVLAGEGLCRPCVLYPRSWRGRARMADMVARLGPDLVLVLPNSFESALAAWYWRGRRRIGYDTGGRGWLLTDRVPMPEARVHQVELYLRLLTPLDVGEADLVPRLRPATDAAADARASELLTGVSDRGAPLVGIHLGAAFGPSKVLPPDRIAELCRSLTRRGVIPVLLGAPADRPVVEQVSAKYGEELASLVGKDSVDLLPALLKRLRGLVSGDTGVAHLAAALGTPVVALFGPTDPARSAPRGPVTVLTHTVPCAPCFYRECPIEHPCLRAIAPDAIADAVLARIDDHQAPAVAPAPPSTIPRTGDR